MGFRNILHTDIQFFESILDKNRVLTQPEQLEICASDQTEDLRYMPEVVLQPVSTSEISAVLRYCNEQLLPVTPRGAGTGLSGGALPVMGGVVRGVPEGACSPRRVACAGRLFVL